MQQHSDNVELTISDLNKLGIVQRIMAVADRALERQHSADMQQLEISQIDIGKKCDDDREEAEPLERIDSIQMNRMLLGQCDNTFSAVSCVESVTQETPGGTHYQDADMYDEGMLDLYGTTTEVTDPQSVSDGAAGDADDDDDDDDEDGDTDEHEAEDTFIMEEDTFPRMPTISYFDRPLKSRQSSKVGQGLEALPIHQQIRQIQEQHILEQEINELNALNEVDETRHDLNGQVYDPEPITNITPNLAPNMQPRLDSLRPMQSSLLTPRSMKTLGTQSTESTMTGQTIRPHLRGMGSKDGFSIFYDNVSETAFGSERSPTFTLTKDRTRGSRHRDSTTEEESDDISANSDDDDIDGDEGDFNRNSLRQSLREEENLFIQKWDCSQWLRQHRVLFFSTVILSAATSSLWIMIDSKTLNLSLLTLYLFICVLSVGTICRCLWIITSKTARIATQQRWQWCGKDTSSSACQQVNERSMSCIE